MLIYQAVIDLAEKEVRKHPDYARFDAKLWSNKGEALSRLGRYEEAMEAYSTALSINPKYERAVQGKNHAEEEILRARGFPQILFLRPKTAGLISDYPMFPSPSRSL